MERRTFLAAVPLTAAGLALAGRAGAEENIGSVGPISPESWLSWAIVRTSPRFAGWTARKLAAAAQR